MRVIAGKYGGRRLHAPRGTATRPTSDRVREALFSILDGPTPEGLEAAAGGLEAVAGGLEAAAGGLEAAAGGLEAAAGGLEAVAGGLEAVAGSLEAASGGLGGAAGGLEGAIVLDLFAGTGALAIEALSRGAARAVLVERDARALRALRANLAELRLDAQEAEVRRADALAAVRNARERSETYDLVFVDPPYRQAGVLGRELREALPPLLAPRARVVLESDRRTEPLLQSPLLEVQLQRRYGDTVITIQRLR
jgi:16S rRNA (guanine966-N2)-methyltransferase